MPAPTEMVGAKMPPGMPVQYENHVASAFSTNLGTGPGAPAAEGERQDGGRPEGRAGGCATSTALGRATGGGREIAHQ